MKKLIALMILTTTFAAQAQAQVRVRALQAPTHAKPKTCYNKPGLVDRVNSSKAANTLLIKLNPTVLSCLNIYSSKGDIVRKAKGFCHDVQWFIHEQGRLRKFTLNNQDEIDQGVYKYNRPDKLNRKYGLVPRVLFDPLDPPPFIGVMGLKNVRCFTQKVSHNKIIDAYSYEEILENSWNDMDFSTSNLETYGAQHSYINGVLYLDVMDSGNFLWGFATAKLGISLPVALSGAHLNARFYDEQYKWDSKADQDAIKQGHHFFMDNMTGREKLREIIDYLVW